MNITSRLEEIAQDIYLDGSKCQGCPHCTSGSELDPGGLGVVGGMPPVVLGTRGCSLEDEIIKCPALWGMINEIEEFGEER